MKIIKKIALISSFFAYFLVFSTSYAGGGDDHVHADEVKPVIIDNQKLINRLTVSGELVEIVGIINHKNLNIYIDYADDNSSVKNAQTLLSVNNININLLPISNGEYYQANLEGFLLSHKDVKELNMKFDVKLEHDNESLSLKIDNPFLVKSNDILKDSEHKFLSIKSMLIVLGIGIVFILLVFVMLKYKKSRNN
jgi:hypothetical protein